MTSKFFEDIVNRGRTAMVALNDFTPLQGGVPIVVDGQVVGGVGVSGAPNAAQDEALAMVGAATLAAATGKDDPPGVLYFPAEQVSKAFEKGAALYNGDNGARNYIIVHASHRDSAGMAEIHTKDTDVIYVLSGKATFVTEGTAVETKNITSDEIRGASISGGDMRTLNPGDVIIVPNGVPQWFKEIPKPFNYYVVKVR